MLLFPSFCSCFCIMTACARLLYLIKKAMTVDGRINNDFLVMLFGSYGVTVIIVIGFD